MISLESVGCVGKNRKKNSGRREIVISFHNRGGKIAANVSTKRCRLLQRRFSGVYGADVRMEWNALMVVTQRSGDSIQKFRSFVGKVPFFR